MSEATVLFNKGHNENKSRIFRIKTEWEDGYFRLFVVEGTSSWFALVERQHIETLAEQHELEPNVYLDNLREYLSSSSPSITFDIIKKQFIIFRSVEKEKFRIKYFFINLEKLDYQETIVAFVDELSAKYTETLDKVKLLEEQNIQVESQKLLNERKCEEFMELKRKSDLQMYSAFALALNEKKHRIRFLTEVLEESQNGGTQKFNIVLPKIKKEPVPMPSTSSTTKPKEALSDSESNNSDGYNTDDEMKTEKITNEDLDFLGDDSPPAFSLPKRVKSDNSNSRVLASSKEKVEQPQANGLKEEAMIVEENANSDDSDMEFNTQELLARM